MQIKKAFILALLAGGISGQQWHVDSVTVRGESPLLPATCKESGYGYLHLGSRTKLTATEIGDHVLAGIGSGEILTIYPESKSGIFVYGECPKRP
jgi:hypothetical protein